MNKLKTISALEIRTGDTIVRRNWHPEVVDSVRLDETEAKVYVTTGYGDVIEIGASEAVYLQVRGGA